MDPKMIEMNNLRVLNDYLNQTIDVLVRQPRLGQPSYASFSPFSGLPATPGPIGTDTVYGPWQGQPAYSPFGPQSPFGALPLYGTSFGPMDPFAAQRSFGQPSFSQPWGQSFSQPWGPSFSQQPWGPSFSQPWGQSFSPSYMPSFAPTFGGWQQPWSPMMQALVAKQSVLEAMCRACGIPV